MVKGKIHSFDSFGTVDGPGIRFIVFMQGCPLKCKFCHNRDTWDINLGTVYSAEQIIDEACKYKTYMNTSNGGITITGGEPFMQSEFLAELVKIAKTKGIHTCIDTSGFVNTEIADPVLDNTDLIMLSIKHINSDKCRDLVGVGPMKSLWFAKHLDKRNIPLWIRYVVIPGVTDDKEGLQKLTEFINTLSNVERIELLPYHTIGVYKWEKMYDPYTLNNVKAASDIDIENAKSIIEEYLTKDIPIR